MRATRDSGPAFCPRPSSGSPFSFSFSYRDQTVLKTLKEQRVLDQVSTTLFTARRFSTPCASQFEHLSGGCDLIFGLVGE